LRQFSLGVFLLLGAVSIQAQESQGRLSVAPVATAPAASPAPAATPAPTPAQQPVAKAPEPTSNVVDAPLPEIANQPKVITPSQSSSPDGPTGPRDGHWYASIGAGAMVQQFTENGTATAKGQIPLDQGDNGQLGTYICVKGGYDFAVRDVQLAFGSPVPMRTGMELEFIYLGSYEKLDLSPTSTGTGNTGDQVLPSVGTETYNLNVYNVNLNGLVKFEDLPVTPYFGGGVGCAVLYSTNHKMQVDGIDATENPVTYETAIGSANNVCLSLQAIVGLERKIYENLSLFIEYKFLAFMDVQFNYGNESTTTTPPVAGGASSSNDFMAQQIISSGLKWSF
jgi:opacity protein-like surface antigen